VSGFCGLPGVKQEPSGQTGIFEVGEMGPIARATASRHQGRLSQCASSARGNQHRRTPRSAVQTCIDRTQFRLESALQPACTYGSYGDFRSVSGSPPHMLAPRWWRAFYWSARRSVPDRESRRPRRRRATPITSDPTHCAPSLPHLIPRRFRLTGNSAKQRSQGIGTICPQSNRSATRASRMNSCVPGKVHWTRESCPTVPGIISGLARHLA
jgi:hypothetical protein